MSRMNKEKYRLICSEILSLRGGDRNIIKELQSQTKDEVEEVRVMREINELMANTISMIQILNERN